MSPDAAKELETDDRKDDSVAKDSSPAKDKPVARDSYASKDGTEEEDAVQLPVAKKHNSVSDEVALNLSSLFDYFLCETRSLCAEHYRRGR